MPGIMDLVSGNESSKINSGKSLIVKDTDSETDEYNLRCMNARVKLKVTEIRKKHKKRQNKKKFGQIDPCTVVFPKMFFL